MHIQKISIHADSFPTSEYYPFNLKVMRKTPKLELKKTVSFFVGENGSGKSTLLRAIATACGYYIWQGVMRQPSYTNPYEKLLYKHLTIHWRDGRTKPNRAQTGHQR